MLRATPESPRLFDSDALDVLTRIPWWVVPVVYVPIVAALFGWGVTRVGVVAAVALAVAGWFVWTLVEYTLHRTVFHWVPATPWGPRFHFLVHGIHHDWVNDRYRLVMPPAVSLLLGVVFFSLWWVLLGAWVFPFFAGHVAGYLAYDMIHYAVHHARFSARWFVRLKAHHMNHHHNKDGRKFGVSTMVWDRVFGTG